MDDLIRRLLESTVMRWSLDREKLQVHLFFGPDRQSYVVKVMNYDMTSPHQGEVQQQTSKVGFEAAVAQLIELNLGILRSRAKDISAFLAKVT